MLTSLRRHNMEMKRPAKCVLLTEFVENANKHTNERNLYRRVLWSGRVNFLLGSNYECQLRGHVPVIFGVLVICAFQVLAWVVESMELHMRPNEKRLI